MNLDWLIPSSFAHPGRLWCWLLVPLFLLGYVLILRLRGHSGMRFTNTGVLGRIAVKQRTWLRHLAVGLSVLTLVTLTVAYAIPQAKDRVPRERATIVIVIDVSLSMEATDVTPNRLDAAKKEAKQFVDALPEGYNVALVSLSGNSGIRIPPTTDHGAVKLAIDRLSLQESTAIGDAIYSSLDAVARAPKGNDKDPAPAAIILLSDGANTAGRSPRQAATEAAQSKVKIFTLVYGSDNGWVEVDGKREKVPPDEELMRDIAKETGGQSYTAKNADQLKNAYKQVQSKVGYEEVATEVTARWAGLGVVFGVLAALAAIFMAARWA